MQARTCLTSRHSRGFAPGLVIILMATVAVLALWLIPAVQKVTAASARMEASNNLKQLAIACHNHADDVGDLASDALALLRGTLLSGRLDLVEGRRLIAALGDADSDGKDLLRWMRETRARTRNPRERALLDDGIDALAELQRYTHTVVIRLQIIF